MKTYLYKIILLLPLVFAFSCELSNYDTHKIEIKTKASDLELIQKGANETYQNNLTKGKLRYEKMNQRITQGNNELPKSIIQKNIRDKETFYQNYNLEDLEFDSDFLGKEGLFILNRHKVDEESTFSMNFMSTKGDIYCLSNYKSEGKDFLSNSAMIWNQFQLLKKQSKLNLNTKIQNIYRYTVQNLETLKTVYAIIKSIDNGSSEEYNIPVNSDHGKAILGTPNGTAVTWLVHDHFEEMNRVKPMSIKVYNIDFKKNNMKKSASICISFE